MWQFRHCISISSLMKVEYDNSFGSMNLPFCCIWRHTCNNLGIKQKGWNKGHTRNNSFKCPVNFLDKILVWLTNYLLLSIQEAHLPFPFIRVPKVFRHLTRKRVLTMEWIIGESPTDLLSVSTGNFIDHGSHYTERQQFDAKRRLLDLVCNKDLHT